MDDNSHMSCYQLGHLTFSLEGQGAVANALAEEFASLAVTSQQKAPLHFSFVEQLPQLRSAVIADPLKVTHDTFEAKFRHFHYQVRQADRTVQVLVKPILPRNRGKSRLLPPIVRQAAHWNYLDPEHDLARLFIYSVFDYITQAVQLSLGQSYLHASAFEHNGRAIAVAAWSGAGKTSTILKMVGQHGYRFLSDDLGIVDNEGRIWHTPKKLQIYPYNLIGQTEMKRMLLNGRSWIDLASWYWKKFRHGNKAVRRRISAEHLFGPKRISTSATLSDVIFLERHDLDEWHHESTTPQVIASRAAATLIQELDPYHRIAAALGSTAWHPSIPTLPAMIHQSTSILERAFEGRRLTIVRLPKFASPDDVVSYLRNVWTER